MSAPEVDAPVPVRLAPLPSVDLLGLRIDSTSYADAADRIVQWARAGESRSVVLCSVNNVMEAHDDRSYRDVMRRADLVAPDGMPLVWALRSFGAPRSRRVAGTELTLTILDRVAPNRVPIGFLGGTPQVLERMREWVETRFPGTEVAFAASPPFRPLSPEEEARIVSDITASGARIVFVGLGCPKQEVWMDRVRGGLPAVTVGVGAAFDFLSGGKRRAPKIMQRLGLEWAFRLASEPRRLWRRYARHNPRFMVLFAAQLLHRRADRAAFSGTTSSRKERT
jgi:N-acetylglucosaminyldiphosphoundecaprenol N-acetyl-beta-D-mannosaminyltransferase